MGGPKVGLRCSSLGQQSRKYVFTLGTFMVSLALLFPGASANVNMTVYLNSAKVMPPLSGTPLVQGSIHLSFPDNVNPLSNTPSLPIYFDNVQLDSSVLQPITAIQLHAGGVNDASRDILVDFGVNASLPISGSVQVPPAVFRSILADPANFYISVHNAVYQDTGILRGQLPSVVMRVALDSANELPPVGTRANGSAVLTFTGDAVCISDLELLSSQEYTLSGAHIHLGSSSQVGPVVVFFPITGDGTRPACTWVDPGLVQDITFNTSQYYINIHDLENVNYGLVRNQLNTAVATVVLGRGSQVPTVTGGGSGAGQVLIALVGTNAVCFWKLSYTSDVQYPTGLRIGTGKAGQNGPALVTFGPGSQPAFPSGGCQIVPDLAVVNQILNPGTNHYVTLLTADKVNGAATGQLVAPGQISGSLLRLNQPEDLPASSGRNSHKKTIIITAVTVCGAALLILAALVAFIMWRRKDSSKHVDHTELAKKWFNWNPNQEILPVAGAPSPSGPPKKKAPPPPVVIDMPQGGQHMGQVRTPKDSAYTTRSSEKSSGEQTPEGRRRSFERMTSHELAQSLSAGTPRGGALNSRSFSTSSTIAPLLAFGGEVVTSRSFTLREVLIATDYFNESLELGGGGFGKVYRGELEDGSLMAVKRMKKESKQGMREFINEVRLLGRLKHPNLVRLIGFCATDEEQLLCYEYMPNGNLGQHLRGPHKPLSWRMRLEVAIGAAKGLDHLHVIATPPVIHRDIKSSNILLDEDWNAKVADFGLSKAALTNASQPASSTFVRGTPGYFDPEYYEGQRLTEKSDVYAFGVVLLEMLTGKKPIDQSLSSAEGSLAKWARPHLRDPERTLSIVDPRIQGSMTRASVLRVGQLAYQCISLQGEDRPSMSAVVLRLHEANAS